MGDVDEYVDKTLAWLTRAYTDRPDEGLLDEILNVSTVEEMNQVTTALFVVTSAVTEISADALGVKPEFLLRRVALRQSRQREKRRQSRAPAD